MARTPAKSGGVAQRVDAPASVPDLGVTWVPPRLCVARVL